MPVTTPCYASREDVKMAPDFAETARGNSRIDRAIQSVSRLIERQLHRVFYPMDATYKWDWPNYSYANPWRLWLDQWDLQTLTQLQSPPGTNIPLGSVILYPANRLPGTPYTRIELDRSTVAAWGAAATPQLSIWATGTWGYTIDTDPAGTLTAAITSTTATTCNVSDSSLMGVGDTIILDAERMLVQEKTAVTTGLTQDGLGCTTASAADNTLVTIGAGALNLGEVIQLDSERMLITDFSGSDPVVKRAWDGTVLAIHAGAPVYAYRQLTVLRGQLGTTAATHLNAAPVSRHRPPSLIRDLAIAESINRVLQETSGYARMVGEAESARPAPGVALADLWDEVDTAYARKARIRAI